MAIASVQTKTGVQTYATSYSLAFDSNVTNGNVIIFGCSSKKYVSRNFVAGDLTKASGTSTIGTPTLDVQIDNGGVQYSAVWTVPVTGTGTLTLNVNDGDSNTTYRVHMQEVSGADTGGTRIEDTDTLTGTTTPVSGAMTSVGGAIFFGVVSVTDAGYTHAAAGGFTLFGAQSGEGSGSAVYQIFTSGTTDSTEWANSAASPWALASLALKAAASGAPRQMMHLSKLRG